jgi:magnesium-transporting ATPase (P-type)
MKELDLLKKDWEKNAASFEQVSENEIYKMIHKKSSSVVKWIFIISVIELGLGLVLGLMISFTKYDEKNVELIKNLGIYGYYIAVSVILYAVIFFFIYKFYSMYRKIAVDDSTKQLLSTILKTRTVVKQYIAFNLTSFAVLFIVFGGFMFYEGYLKGVAKNGTPHPEMPLNIALISMVVLVLATALLTFALWIVYKLIYGILLKRLQKNYEELKKIDL